MRRYLALLFLLPLSGCLTQRLQTGLSEEEAQRIVVLLKKKGIDAIPEPEPGEKKENATWQVKIKGGDQNLVLAWRILEENGLPPTKVKGLEDVFASSGMIPTASEEKARLLVGLSGEITRTIKTVAGVVNARVHVVLPENSPLVDKSQWSPPTASVLVKYQGAQLPLKEEEIKNLVARGVEGLQPENVAVVFKKVEVQDQLPQDWRGYVGNQEFLVAFVAMSAITSLGCLALSVRGRQQRLRIADLQQQLQESARRVAAAQRAPEVTAGSAGKG